MEAFWTGLTQRLRGTFDPAAMGANLAGVLQSATIAVLVFLAYWVAWRILDPLSRAIIKRTKLDATTATFVQTVLKYGILITGLVHGLGAAGINTAGLITSLGIAGLTIGFAARDALSNIISGLLIFWDRPFVIGDLIEIGDKYGRVETITLRSTRVVTVDGKMLAVPNSEVINTTVASYTNSPHLRLSVPVTVGTSEDLGRIRGLLEDLVRADPEYRREPAPAVVVTALNDYNVQLELRAWLEDERQHIRKRLELREKVFEALRGAQVDMPLETIQLAPLEVRQATPSGAGP